MLNYALGISLALALGQASPQSPADQRGATPRKVEGQWNVVYVEMEGKKLEADDFKDIVIEGDKLKITHEGKRRIYAIEFGPNHRVRAHEIKSVPTTSEGKADPSAKASDTGGRAQGVYIASDEFLCFSLNHEREGGGADGRSTPQATSSPSRQQAEGAHFVLILRRPGGESR